MHVAFSERTGAVAGQPLCLCKAASVLYSPDCSAGRRGSAETGRARFVLFNPKGPCTPIVYTFGPMYLYREYFKAKVYTTVDDINPALPYGP